MSDSLQTLTLGGGCFWCTEAVFVQVRGVEDVESGYCNGQTLQPSYEQVCSGRTGHNEVVRLRFDPAQISVREILEIFFLIHDPTTLNRQGHDSGTQYRSGIYVSTPEQAQVANPKPAAVPYPFAPDPHIFGAGRNDYRFHRRRWRRFRDNRGGLRR